MYEDDRARRHRAGMTIEEQVRAYGGPRLQLTQQVLNRCGERDSSQTDGHPGYDYRLAEGTPLFAVADGISASGEIVRF